MAWKPSEQANMLISTGLLRPDPLALCTSEGQEEAQEGTTKGVYRLTHAIYYYSPCQTLRELLAEITSN